MKKKKVVLIGGGVGSSTFTKALKDVPGVELTTIVSAFDDGGSTGAMRRDYGGVALGDFRQCVLASMDLDEKLVKTLNYRFGRGNLFGVNTGNLIVRAFLEQYPSEREGIINIHKVLNLHNRVYPVSYDFAKLCARLSTGHTLGDQQQIADHLSFAEASIKELHIEPVAKIGREAREAMLAADYLVFAPGHFFTSVLPHLYVQGFASAWKKSRAEKTWFINLLAHRGQDSYYSLRDYLGWFERSLGKKPFDRVVLNKAIDGKVLDLVRDRFEKVNVGPDDLTYLKERSVAVAIADLVSLHIRPQEKNDTIPRAPLRHDAAKIRAFFKKEMFNTRI